MTMNNLNEPFEFRIDYHFATMKVYVGSEDIKNQFLIFLQAGGRLDKLNGGKVDEDSMSQWDTVSEIKDWCCVRGISYELIDKTLWARIMDFLDDRIRNSRELL